MNKIKRILLSNKDLVGILTSILGVIITVIVTSGSEKFLIAGVIGLSILVFLRFTINLNLLKTTIFSFLILLLSLSGYFFDKRLVSRSKKPKMEKFNIVPSSGYTQLESNELIFVQRKNQDAKQLILNMGLTNPSPNTVYIKGVTFKLLDFHESKREIDDSKVVYYKITIVFRRKPTPKEIALLCKKYYIDEVDSFEEMYIFSTDENFTKTKLQSLKDEAIVATVEATSIGTGFFDITPSSLLKPVEPISPETTTLTIDTDKGISPRGPERFHVALEFSQIGTYVLKGWINYGDEKLSFPKFTVVVDR